MEIFGAINVETPKFQLLKKLSHYEIRKYPSFVSATVETPGTLKSKSEAESGFSYLAGYIFGKNERKDTKQVEKIAMTAPVLMEQKKSDAVQMSFILPSKYKSVDDLPVPKDAKVELKSEGEATYAVKVFSGYCSGDEYVKQSEALRGELGSDEEYRAKAGAKYILAQYNPPWTLWFLRTNEIMVMVEKK